MKFCFSSLYSTPRFLNAMAAFSPNVKWLEVECGYESPINALTRFENLTHLSMTKENRFVPSVSSVANDWPQLETLIIDGLPCSQGLSVHHFSLKVLTILNGDGLAYPNFTCRSLESLTLRSARIEPVHFLAHLNSRCPNLKKVEIEKYRPNGGRVEEAQGPSTFSHDFLEDLTLVNFLTTPTHIMCPKLGKLVLRWDGSDVKKPNMEGKCPSLTTLQIFGYNIEAHLSSVLCALPSLKSLSIDGRDLVLEQFSRNGVR